MNMALRGKCYEMSAALCANNPALTLVRGHYLCPIWGEQAHWWCVSDDGAIVDPTAEQFPSGGLGEYIPFDGHISCSNCGVKVPESDAYDGGNGRHMFCSCTCYGQFVL